MSLPTRSWIILKINKAGGLADGSLIMSFFKKALLFENRSAFNLLFDQHYPNIEIVNYLIRAILLYEAQASRSGVSLPGVRL